MRRFTRTAGTTIRPWDSPDGIEQIPTPLDNYIEEIAAELRTAKTEARQQEPPVLLNAGYPAPVGEQPADSIRQTRQTDSSRPPATCNTR